MVSCRTVPATRSLCLVATEWPDARSELSTPGQHRLRRHRRPQPCSDMKRDTEPEASPPGSESEPLLLRLHKLAPEFDSILTLLLYFSPCVKRRSIKNSLKLMQSPTAKRYLSLKSFCSRPVSVVARLPDVAHVAASNGRVVGWRFVHARQSLRHERSRGQRLEYRARAPDRVPARRPRAERPSARDRGSV